MVNLAAFNISDINGTNGFRISAQGPFSFAGRSVSGAGDVNGDGIADVIVGAFPINSFRYDSYVVFGSREAFPATINSSSSPLNGSNGFTITGAGDNVSGAGDINGDGIDDLIVNSYPANNYVVFGSREGFPTTLNPLTLDGSNGFNINTNTPPFLVGSSNKVSGAGDVNGDGISDLIIGVSNASYVVFGSRESFSSSFDVSTLNGSNGFTINAGYPVSDAGDINDDGTDDLIVGSRNVVFGNSEGFPASIDVSTLNGANGFTINGGSGVTSAEDVNGDGIDDLILGNGSNQSYVVFGNRKGLPATLDVSTLDGVNGFTLNGAGYSVSGAGDVNGDGVDDVVIGGAFTSPLTDPNVSSASYIVYGSRAGFQANINLATLDGINGFPINSFFTNPVGWRPDSSLGYSVSGAGDVNGDGLDDVILGSPNAGGSSGYGVVVFGQVPIVGTDCNDTLYGTEASDRIFGGRSDDTLFGGEGVNTLGGGDGDDVIYGGSGVDYIDGGNGSDRIFAAEGNNRISGGAGDDIIYSGAGNNVIYSSPGNDTIWLGGGSDRIVLESGNGVDTINNFQPGKTAIAITDTSLYFLGLNYVQEGNNTLVEITSTSEDLALLIGVQASSLSGSFPIDTNQTTV